MADEAAEHHRSFWPDGSRERLEQRSPIDQELGSDERLSKVWNLCFGWQARASVTEQIERPLEFYKGLDCITPNFRNQSTVNQ
jgi:hypothetical protein